MTVDFEREFDLARPEILTQQRSLELCGPAGIGVDEEWIVVSQELTSSKGHTQTTAFFKAVKVKVSLLLFLLLFFTGLRFNGMLHGPPQGAFDIGPPSSNRCLSMEHRAFS